MDILVPVLVLLGVAIIVIGALRQPPRPPAEEPASVDDPVDPDAGKPPPPR